MVESAGNFMSMPVDAAKGTYNRARLFIAVATLTTSGAVNSYTGSSPGVVVAKPSGTGIYTITVPAALAIGLAGNPVYVQASGVDMGVTVTSVVASTGVITLTLKKDDGTSGIPAAADGTSGDSIIAVIVALF